LPFAHRSSRTGNPRQGREGARTVELYRWHPETFITPARAFGTPLGENDGRDSQVTSRPCHPPRHSAFARARARMIFVGHSTFFTSRLLRLAEPRVSHYLYQGSIVAPPRPRSSSIVSDLTCRRDENDPQSAGISFSRGASAFRSTRRRETLRLFLIRIP